MLKKNIKLLTIFFVCTIFLVSVLFVLVTDRPSRTRKVIIGSCLFVYWIEDAEKVVKTDPKIQSALSSYSARGLNPTITYDSDFLDYNIVIKIASDLKIDYFTMKQCTGEVLKQNSYYMYLLETIYKFKDSL